MPQLARPELRLLEVKCAGLPVNSAQVMDRDANLYMAGRRRFGTWAAALDAAGVVTAVAGATKRRKR